LKAESKDRINMAEVDQVAYKELLVWQKSMEFATQVIQMMDGLDTPRKHYRLFEQLESAVTSVLMNIAEGKGRESKKEFIHFLYIARGSIYETLTLLEIFQRQIWLNPDKFKLLESSAIEIIKMLKGLIKAISKTI
jgi:four helix bundle protein